MRRIFVPFFEESSARKKTFQDYLTFKTEQARGQKLTRDFWTKFWGFGHCVMWTVCTHLHTSMRVVAESSQVVAFL